MRKNNNGVNYKMKRGYFVQGPDDNWGVPVVAHTAKEAKKMVFNFSELDCEWIELRVKWQRNANVDDMPIGCIYNEELALKIGLYDYLEGAYCDECRCEGTCVYDNGKIVCLDCRDGNLNVV